MTPQMLAEACARAMWRDDHASQGLGIDLLHVEADLAGDDAAHVEQVVDQLGLGAGVALDGVEALGERRLVFAAAAQDL